MIFECTCTCEKTYWKRQKSFLDALAKRSTGRDSNASWMHLRKDLVKETEKLLGCTCEKTYWKRQKCFLNALTKRPSGIERNASWMHLRKDLVKETDILLECTCEMTYWKRQKRLLNALTKSTNGRDRNASWMLEGECFMKDLRGTVQCFKWVFCPTFITLKVAWGIITSQTIRLAVSPSSFSFKCQRMLCPKSAIVHVSDCTAQLCCCTV